jgi:hypothetical protein
MKNPDETEYHPIAEQLTQVLCKKTQSDNPLFFRVLVAYYFSVVASMMRCTIVTHDRGDIPVNAYAINLSPSGTGKGFSTNIMENSVIHLFRQRFLEETFPLLAELNLPKIANKRAARKGTDPEEELLKVTKEFEAPGSLLFSFSEATSPAIKQMRHRLLMADAAALNLQIDEIGSNLSGSIEALNTYLELYDVGAIKQKLTKNTADSKRAEEIHGRTPANLMAFGTPSKLLDGAKNEEELYSLLETGYARRCLFGYIRAVSQSKKLTPEQIYDALTDQSNDTFLDALANQLENLADMANVNKRLLMTKETSLILIEYKLKCEEIAHTYADHEEIKKAETSHRYFKALKVAGGYAFIDGSPTLTTEHLYNAIKLVEESGAAFNQLLTRDRNYVKLAKYISSFNKAVTQADLVEDLPFYKGGIAQKSEMMNLAIAYGYNNHIIIKKLVSDGIEFFRGESLQETDHNKLIVSYGTQLAEGYKNEYAPWDKLHKLTQTTGLHWTAHHLVDGYRKEENAIGGFNLIVVDVDGGIDISTAQLLLKNYRYLIYTTKRHTESENRFRLILPTNYKLFMDAKEYKEFMVSVSEWLPFTVDQVTFQRAKKWLSHDGSYFYNDGDIFDVLPFIPKTSKNEERKAKLKNQQSLDNLERWVLAHGLDDGRNNALLKYALVLVDAGFSFDDIRKKVLSLNDKLPDKLDETEVMGTVFVTVARKLSKLGT